MKTAAIIAEYNPFHNGHKYQIEETKRLTGADFILVVMSGDFVQRGAPAIFNKYLRTQMALLGGADVVLELPTLYAVSSAEFFASGSIALLEQLGVVDYLSFGSECGNIPMLEGCARLLLSEPLQYRHLLSAFLKQGLSFPAARSKAFWQTAGSASLLGEIPDDFLASPNNILALEYCKALLALHSSVLPVTVKRLGDAYHEASLNKSGSMISSASAIRNTIESMHISENEQQAVSCPSSFLRAAFPETVFDFLLSSKLLESPGAFLTCNDFSSLLHYRLLTECQHGFTQYLDCDSALSDRIKKYLPDFSDFAGFAALLKSKNVTYTRINRTLTHILLQITTPSSYLTPLSARELPLPYIRLLGFRKDAAKLLSAIRQNSAVPLISKLADAKNKLDDGTLAMLEQDVLAGNIYESVFSQKYKKRPPVNEYRQSPVIL